MWENIFWFFLDKAGIEGWDYFENWGLGGEELFVDTYIILLINLSNYGNNSATVAWAVNWIFKKICMLLSVYFLLHMMYRKVQRQNYTCNFIYIYSFFIPYTEFCVTHM